MDNIVHERSPQLVGSTAALYDGSIAETKAKELRNTTQHSGSHSVSASYDEAEHEAKYFKSAQSYCIITFETPNDANARIGLVTAPPFLHLLQTIP